MDARVLVAAALVVVLGCKREEAAPRAPAPTAAPPVAAKPARVPITSASSEAVALFKEGRDLEENFRHAEAAAKFKEALAKDPQFVQARAYLGLATWPAGHSELQAAIGSSASLPEAERTLIEMLRARSVGDDASEEKALARLTELVPDDARVHTWHGEHLVGHGRREEAISAFTRAVELEPGAASAWNGLGYALIDARRFDEAAQAFRSYAKVRPQEPNPLDSLGDAQLMSGRYAEAEQSYRKALAVSPAFSVAWHGIAVSRALRGDLDGAREALSSQIAASTRPVDKVTPRFDAAWSYLVEKRHADALSEIALAGKEAQERSLRPTDAIAAGLHAFVLLDGGKPRDALKQLEIAHRRLDGAVGRAPPVAVQNVRAWVRRLQTDAWARLGEAEQAAAAVKAFEESLDGIEPTPVELNHLSQARGFAALARKDTQAAVAEFERCPTWSFTCGAQLVLAREKAGDAEGVRRAREAFSTRSYRSLEFAYVKTRVLGMPLPSAMAAPAP